MTKQDILNAFREKFVVTDYGWGSEGYATKLRGSIKQDDLEQWLLTTLTEFESGIIEEGRKYADTQFNTEALTNFLDMLEKEKQG